MELFTPGFVMFFFGLSAATVGLFAMIFGESFDLTWQLIAFSAFSIVYLLVLRRFAMKIFSGSVSQSAADFDNDYVGRTGVVTSAIVPPLPGKVELGDIVVFNFPAGDTVAVNQAATFYDMCVQQAAENYANQNVTLPHTRSLSIQEQRELYETLYSKGKQIVKANPDFFGEVVVRPADRRENYVKRCVGLPGQVFEIKDKVIYVDGKPEKQPDNVQFNYHVYVKEGVYLNEMSDLCNELGISDEDCRNWMRNPEYGMALTDYARKGLLKHTDIVDSITPIKDNSYFDDSNPFYHIIFGMVYPINHDYGWTRDNYGPVTIPAKGMTIDLNEDNIAIYERPIRTYEGNKLAIKDGKIYINGKQTDKYTFKMDYYWMMGDNRHNSADSRYWGFVPEDHIVGKPLFVWLSVSPDANPKSRIRWNRLFKWVGDIK